MATVNKGSAGKHEILKRKSRDSFDLNMTKTSEGAKKRN